ncbi:FTR1 family protein [Aneurinibacillus thermoaerophilus]|uniref:FTR1 family protein n=1 Tax=Aneurinibacillus thermoaerophilus TaxID=143495 RepID=A0A1G7ZM80_ANETH|nr:MULTISPECIES: FTR1 family protein [Aneurinibacillus]AMA72453.1 iron permease [Aneurinibacillus sp. XH2]MED0758765.1 FTR1 family protein [Aneurinibacillus thermoaerophilus]MED0759459.1 FTR1 family protein [Aneurinibacillus thermoaerophilus]QYY41798.1 FTR1 family protein [Aneurinibacillus thermoaerophilus]SDH09788.1 high-affinity iron transporter [Aneurinibacillus thermoaerophilus]
MELQAFLITFREALEALLIVGIITSYLKRVNRPEFTKYVWLGAALAIIASLGLALVFQVVLDGFATMGAQTYMKVGIMIISGLLLTQMVFWMAAQAKDISSEMKGKYDRFITTGNVIGMVVHAFLVVLREGVETVFFFAAITGGDIGKAMQTWGSFGGIVLAAVVSFLFFRGTMRIPLKTFFKVTGAFIVLIAAGLIVQAISILQDMNILGSLVPHVYDLTWFMPEHPIDEQHYIRDTGHTPVISGDVGVFLKALFGYASSPSLEECLVYWGYFLGLYLLLRGRNERKDAAEGMEYAKESQAKIKEA